MNIPRTKKISKCRLCSNKKLSPIYKFGKFFVSNFVSKNNINKGIKAPLNLVHCRNCDLLQLSHSAPQEIMYKNFYWYRSSVTKLMRSALKEIFVASQKYVKLDSSDLVLDIGANDGTLLKYFKEKKIQTIGCEPAKNLSKQLNKNCDYMLNDFWSYEALKKLFKKKNIYKKPKLITAIGMFYDLEDPGKFISDAAKCLDDKGIFIAQLMCLNSMIEKNDLGNICHEHLEFYSYKSLKYLFENNGFKIFKIEENNINGGSYRIFCKKNIKKSIAYKEKTTLSQINKFFSRVEKNKKKTVNFIKKEVKKGKKIFLYGASTKGNVLLQYYKINNKIINYAAERNKNKYNLFTPGTKIKIVSEKYSRFLKPDYYLVLPWHFKNEILKREKKIRAKGTKFIFPLPNLKVF